MQTKLSLGSNEHKLTSGSNEPNVTSVSSETPFVSNETSEIGDNMSPNYPVFRICQVCKTKIPVNIVICWYCGDYKK